MGCLVTSFINNDFSVRYVAENSNFALPLDIPVLGLTQAPLAAAVRINLE